MTTDNIAAAINSVPKMSKADAVADMEDIYNRIVSGEYAHNQYSYFCETGNCFAGWKAVRDYPFTKYGESSATSMERVSDKVYNTDDLGSAPDGIPVHAILAYSMAYDYAAQRWQLSSSDAWEMFRGSASLYEQKAVIDRLKSEL